MFKDNRIVPKPRNYQMTTLAKSDAQKLSRNELMLKSLNESRKYEKHPRRGPAGAGLSFDVMTRLKSLDALFFFGEAKGEVLRHIPVSAISALQTCWKGLVIDLVNKGEPYRGRGASLLDDRAKLRDVVDWFHNDSYTFGEVVAYSLTFNSITDLESVASTLFGFKFKDKIKDLAQSLPKDPIFGNGLPSDVNNVFQKVEQTFKLRHVLAHEAAAGLELDADNVRAMLSAVLTLVLALKTVLEETVYAGSKKSMVEMTKEKVNLRQEAVARLEEAVQRAVDMQPTNPRTWIQESHQKWNEFREHWGSMSYGSLDGTEWPFIRAVEDIKMLDARIEEVRTWNAMMAGDDVSHPDHPFQRDKESKQRD
jgi:hypothetical protein